MAACEHGAKEAVEFLLQHHANPIPQDSIIHNAITCAIEGGELSILQQLLRIDLPTIYWVKALQKAIWKKRPEMVSALLPRCPMNPLAVDLPAAENPLLLIPYDNKRPGEIRKRHQILAILLREARLPRHHVSAIGDDALMLAVNAQDALAVEMLINDGLRVGQLNRNGWLAMHLAIHELRTYVNHNKNDREKNREKERDAIQAAQISCRILRAVSQTLLQHPHQAHLANDVLLHQTDPIKRDLALFLMHANSTSSTDIPQLMTLGLKMGELYYAVFSGSADVSNAALAPILSHMGVPSALHGSLIP
jgi:ankyrin repeat protein